MDKTTTALSEVSCVNLRLVATDGGLNFNDSSYLILELVMAHFEFVVQNNPVLEQEEEEEEEEYFHFFLFPIRLYKVRKKCKATNQGRSQANRFCPSRN